MRYVHNNGILFSLKKEGNSDRCYDMDKPNVAYATPAGRGDKRKNLEVQTALFRRFQI